MSWTDKIHKQRQVDTLLREIMQRPEWREEKKKIEEEAVVRSMKSIPTDRMRLHEPELRLQRKRDPEMAEICV